MPEKHSWQLCDGAWPVPTQQGLALPSYCLLFTTRAPLSFPTSYCSV